MQVRELQERLSELNPGLSVVCYTEDEEFVSPERSFRSLEIEHVKLATGEMARDEDRKPYLKLGNTPASVDLAALVITTVY